LGNLDGLEELVVGGEFTKAIWRRKERRRSEEEVEECDVDVVGTLISAELQTKACYSRANSETHIMEFRLRNTVKIIGGRIEGMPFLMDCGKFDWHFPIAAHYLVS
jgi:hypothetical protein